MNYEEIIERLLDERHISAKEALYLLKQCSQGLPIIDYDKLVKDVVIKPYDIETNPCDTCNMKNVFYIGDSPCSHCTKEGAKLRTTITC